MTRGSENHDAVSGHFKRCTQCRDVDPERTRIQQATAHRRTVPDAAFAALCPVGRLIYRDYLRWLAEPDE